MQYGEITSKVADPTLTDRGNGYGVTTHSMAAISKMFVIRQSDHVAACKYLREECGIHRIDINSMCPQFIQAVFENEDDQILFMLACECDKLSGDPGVVEKEVHILNYRQVRESFQNAIDQIGLMGNAEVRHVVRMEARTFTKAQMDEFERRFAVGAPTTPADNSRCPTTAWSVASLLPRDCPRGRLPRMIRPSPATSLSDRTE